MLNVEHLKSLRTQAGLAQEVVAELLGVSRLTYASIESGKRDIKQLELAHLARIFEVSKNELLINDVAQSISPTLTKEHPLYKMAQTILYIGEKCAGKTNVGKIVLNKLLYFADFNHFEKYWSSITQYQYIKMPMGPVPKSIDQIVALMQQEELIAQVQSQYYGYTQERIIPLVAPDITVFSATELSEIDTSLHLYSDKSGKRLTDYSHEDTPRKATKNIGDVIEYQLAHYRSPLYSVAQYDGD